MWFEPHLETSNNLQHSQQEAMASVVKAEAFLLQILLQ